ncbi:MAG TPA: flavodoxin family protein [Sphaerochaeta sp.]|nr:flavodoxin family protein [Sphaerochaeta sp.]
MHVLLINTSVHESGCTNRALREVATTLEENGVSTEILWIGNCALHGCTACGYCFEHGRCVHDDGMVNVAAEKAIASDALIIGSPVYYASMCGQGSAFSERLFRVAGSRLTHKPAAAVVSTRRGGASATFDRINKFFTLAAMPVVSSTYWNSVHGNTPEEVEQDLEGLQVMRNLGRNMAWLIQAIKAGPTPPTMERDHKTSFIR